MPEVRTYEITVRGFPPVLHSARRPAKARASAYRSFISAYPDCTFKHFLGISSVRRVDNPPGLPRRILVQGVEVTMCLPSGRYGAGDYVYYMKDGEDYVMCSHPLDVSEIETCHTSTSSSSCSAK